MLRRIGLFLCLAGAGVVGWAWHVSLHEAHFAAWPLEARQWIGFHVAEGRARLFLITSRDHPVTVKLDPYRGDGILVQERVAFLPNVVREWSGNADLGTISRAARIRIGPVWMMRSFGWGHDLNRRFHPQIGVSFVRLPLWFPVVGLLFAPLMGFIFGPVRRRLRSMRGQCRGCGYDLSGMRHARCPECGRRVSGQESSLQPA